MYEATALTVKDLKVLLDTLPDDAVIAGECCQSSTAAHVAEAVEFDSTYGGRSEHYSIPALTLRQDEHGRTMVLLNLDDDYVGIKSEEDTEGE